MQVKVLKTIIHNAIHRYPGEIITLEDHLVSRLEKIGTVSKDLNTPVAGAKVQPTQPAQPQLPAEPGVDDKKEEKLPEVEDGGSEDKDVKDAKKSVEGDGDIEEGGSEDKDTEETNTETQTDTANQDQTKTE